MASPATVYEKKEAATENKSAVTTIEDLIVSEGTYVGQDIQYLL